MANEAPVKYDRAFTLRVDDAFLAQIDDLRALDRPVLSRADYIRKMVESLHAERCKKKR